MLTTKRCLTTTNRIMLYIENSFSPFINVTKNILTNKRNSIDRKEIDIEREIGKEKEREIEKIFGKIAIIKNN